MGCYYFGFWKIRNSVHLRFLSFSIPSVYNHFKSISHEHSKTFSKSLFQAYSPILFCPVLFRSSCVYEGLFKTD